MGCPEVERKARRLQDGGTPRVVDLFAGAGGLSLGFHAAGCKLVAAVEFDPDAARTHGLNFFADADGREVHTKARDITATSPADLLQECNVEGPLDEAVDIVIGGPPCQAFARVGRAKLREIAAHPEAFIHDDRANLYLAYLDYVRQMKPVAILMENVPDILNFGGTNIAETVCELLEHLGYNAKYSLFNSVHYGVPQMRERMIMVATHKGSGVEFRFPEATHHATLPPGYDGTRAVALQGIRAEPDRAHPHFVELPRPTDGRQPAVTAREALDDLPPITKHLRGQLKRGARRFDQVEPYPKNGKLGAYARLMREWPEFANREGIADHVIRSLPRDYAIFRIMKAGDQYPEAHKAAKHLFEKELARRRDSGEALQEGSGVYKGLWKSIVPPYDPTKFPNRWRKMEPDAPARTLMAHLGKDSYTHIHYDSKQARTISVREAARLQSFPDGFVFSGTMNPAFRQIGNAVPPLFAKAMAEQLVASLKRKVVTVATHG